jgi:hypothetical protein
MVQARRLGLDSFSLSFPNGFGLEGWDWTHFFVFSKQFELEGWIGLIFIVFSKQIELESWD